MPAGLTPRLPPGKRSSARDLIVALALVAAVIVPNLFIDGLLRSAENRPAPRPAAGVIDDMQSWPG